MGYHSRLEFTVFGLGVFIAVRNSFYNCKQSNTNLLEQTYINFLQFPESLSRVVIFIILFSIFFIGYFYFSRSCGILHREDKIKLRKFADCGSWCSSLLPITLAISYINFSHVSSWIYLITELLSLGLLLASLTVIFYYIERSHISQWHIFYLTYCVHVPLTGVLLWKFATVNLFSSFLISFICHLIFYSLIMSSPPHFKLSFSFGEAVLVSQGVSLFLTTSLFCLLPKLANFLSSDGKCSETSDTTKFLQVLLLGCAIAIFFLYSFPYFRLPYMFYLLWFAVAIMVLYPVGLIYLGTDPVLWLLKFICKTPIRIALMACWVTSTVIAILIVTCQNVQNTSKVSTMVRKYFHALVILVYVPGLVWDIDLLYLASGVALAIFLFLECIRVLCIPPFGKVIHSAFSVFLDEKDSGYLILTHIYLLVGCSSPLWIFPVDFNKVSFHIATFSGIIAIGVGDTAASIGGTLWGRHKWPGTKKTLEGTLCAIILQFFVSLAFFLYVGIPLSLEITWIVFVATSLTAVLEAVTTQIDNLVLPLFLFMMFIGVK